MGSESKSDSTRFHSETPSELQSKSSSLLRRCFRWPTRTAFWAGLIAFVLSVEILVLSHVTHVQGKKTNSPQIPTLVAIFDFVGIVGILAGTVVVTVSSMPAEILHSSRLKFTSRRSANRFVHQCQGAESDGTTRAGYTRVAGSTSAEINQ